MRTLCIALHDVAPATWPQCEALLAFLDGLGAAPLTLLAVPDFHGRGGFEAAPAITAALRARQARGDAIALHGLRHRDENAPPRTPVDWLRRRVLTAGEGEFAALAADAAARRIREGRERLGRLGFAIDGCVPPAWLASAGTRVALRRSGLRWASSHAALHDLVEDRRLPAPCLTASPRSAWRRGLSRAWLRGLLRATRRTPLLRVGLHPDDVLHPALLAVWSAVLQELLATRAPLTKSQAVAAACVAAPAR
ncbi:MAG: polysaccharide deacetylase family protein [Xanthomonadaceae bacterium]|nr:polysaccharide deacetylase family protein [Xanthomonadaceae bacterium]MDE1957565.1 polysaccharide deacetylase family protein [Xanthomonadaceae bacterium]MDE2177296.1 polysaccharide deacetylase family protein [Xanthomonadaceae bacterium]MDE2244921.1 polysaccharide deacetylase family protein [Xanthomonadaceae bacterium]